MTPASHKNLLTKQMISFVFLDSANYPKSNLANPSGLKAYITAEVFLVKPGNRKTHFPVLIFATF